MYGCEPGCQPGHWGGRVQTLEAVSPCWLRDRPFCRRGIAFSSSHCNQAKTGITWLCPAHLQRKPHGAARGPILHPRLAAGTCLCSGLPRTRHPALIASALVKAGCWQRAVIYRFGALQGRGPAEHPCFCEQHAQHSCLSSKPRRTGPVSGQGQFLGLLNGANIELWFVSPT